VVAIFKPGDHVIASEDLYGGTYRLFETIARTNGLRTSYVDTSDIANIDAACSPATRAIFLETPTNPTMKVTSLRAAVGIARTRGLLCIVDNTFMTPFLQRPIELGADIVLHSATKYLGGHNDVIAGLVVTRTAELSERIAFIQNASGGILGPFDSWLLIRGMKTLAIRMERAETNAKELAAWLTGQSGIACVHYPGLPTHPGHAVHQEQANGFGAMLSFRVGSAARAEKIINRMRTIIFAESLGGVESLITYPARQTHADIPPEIRARIGVTDDLLRLSVGIEHIDDLRVDLDQALAP
jgi:cystathionine gamma-synthase